MDLAGCQIVEMNLGHGVTVRAKVRDRARGAPSSHSRCALLRQGRSLTAGDGSLQPL
jgi:hypothetical protein